MTDSFFQKIYDIIRPTLPEKWMKIVLYAAFIDENCETKYFVKQTNGTEFIDCFEFITNHIVLFQTIIDLQIEISKERNNSVQKDLWNLITITIDSAGNFESFYDYSNTLWMDQDYFSKWSNNYLR